MKKKIKNLVLKKSVISKLNLSNISGGDPNGGGSGAPPITTTVLNCDINGNGACFTDECTDPTVTTTTGTGDGGDVQKGTSAVATHNGTLRCF